MNDVGFEVSGDTTERTDSTPKPSRQVDTLDEPRRVNWSQVGPTTMQPGQQVVVHVGRVLDVLRDGLG